MLLEVIFWRWTLAVDGTVVSCWCAWLPALLTSRSSVCGRVPELSSRGGSGPM
ncbi:UNVERIFIED_CONTAM: hypothetical protein FKN15_004987 [Acipenser sinensis]